MTAVVGREDGSIEIWFTVRTDGGDFTLSRIREFPSHPGPIRLLSPSLRDKGFLAQDDAGQIGLLRRLMGAGPLRKPNWSAISW